jgi:hypothetical protein
MSDILTLEISYEGCSSDIHRIDLYDVSRAMMGIHRSLAITTHLLLNKNIISKCTSLKNAEIISLPSEDGSWKMKIVIALGSVFGAAMIAPQNSFLGHVIYSAYDYVLSESMGVHVDYEKSLGKLYLENKNKNIHIPEQHILDLVIDKCHNSLIDIHRPIYESKTAKVGELKAFIGKKEFKFSSEFNQETFEYLTEEIHKDELFSITGKIVSFSATNYSGRISIDGIDRPIPFKLERDVKTNENFEKIIESLKNSTLKDTTPINVTLDVKVIQTKKGKIKKYIVKKVWKNSL